MKEITQEYLSFFGEDVVIRTRMRGAVATTFLRLEQHHSALQTEQQKVTWIQYFNHNCDTGVTHPAFKDPIPC